MRKKRDIVPNYSFANIVLDIFKLNAFFESQISELDRLKKLNLKVLVSPQKVPLLYIKHTSNKIKDFLDIRDNLTQCKRERKRILQELEKYSYAERARLLYLLDDRPLDVDLQFTNGRIVNYLEAVEPVIEKGFEYLDRETSAYKKSLNEPDTLKHKGFLKRMSTNYNECVRDLKEALQIIYDNAIPDHLLQKISELEEKLLSSKNLLEDLEKANEGQGNDQNLERVNNEELLVSSKRACLPGARQKREADNDCSYSWEDVDEFNEEKDEPRDSDKIQINSEKFLNYIQNIPEEKRAQLIELAGQVEVTGKFKSLINRLVHNKEAINHLNKVGKVSSVVMHGMMAKNVLSAFLNGDYKGVAINIGFIAGGQGLAKVAEAASVKGVEMVADGKLLLGRSLRLASPFLARGTSAFVVYDLVNQVKEYKKGNNDALVGVVGDSIYLGVDVVETGIEIAEVFEVLEGVSSVTGPIGAAIGAVVFVGTDIYMAVRRVGEEDKIIHLTGEEKFNEGLLAFLNMKPEQYIRELMEEKEINNKLVEQGLSFLKNNPGIQRYVFPTQKPITNCYPVKWQEEILGCQFHLGCTGTGRYKTYEREECKVVGYKTDLDNEVLLNRERADIKWSRAKPDKGKLFCLPEENDEQKREICHKVASLLTGRCVGTGVYETNDEQIPSNEAYLCKNAIGIENENSSNKTEKLTFINVGEGDDYVRGFLNSPNVILASDGRKRLYGGEKDDLFILEGDVIEGNINGNGGIDTLDLGNFALGQNKIYLGQVYVTHGDYNYSYLEVRNINRVLTRKGKADIIHSTCDTEYIDSRGGESNNLQDFVHVGNCENSISNLQIVVGPYTKIYNRASKGSFTYIVKQEKGEASINLYGGGSHSFLFNHALEEIDAISFSESDFDNRKTIKFTFLPDATDHPQTSISYTNNINGTSYELSDGSTILVGKKSSYAMQSSNKSVDEIVKDYPAMANRLKMSFFILASNEMIAVGHGNHDVLHNDPEHKSHLVGNGGENIYKITSGCDRLSIFDNLYVNDVTIYDLDKENSIDTLDLRNIVQQVKKDLPGWSIATEVVPVNDQNSLSLNVTIRSPKDSPDSLSLLRVKLRDICVENRYEKLHIILNNAPMKLERVGRNWELKPLPLKFEKDKEVIVITDQDIEKESELVIPKRIEGYAFIYNDDNDLIITNVRNANITKNDQCKIIFSKFYQEHEMREKSLSTTLRFIDQELILKDYITQINNALSLDSIKDEYKGDTERLLNLNVTQLIQDFMVGAANNNHSEVVNSLSSEAEELNLESEMLEVNEDEELSSNHSEMLKDNNLRIKRDTEAEMVARNHATKQSSWINDLFGWVKSSVSGLLGSKSSTTTKSSISQVHAPVDVNGTIMLLDVLVRKVTGQKYISTADQSISPLEAKGYVLNIIKRFEKVLNQTAIKSGISVTNLNFDPVAVQSAIVGKIISGRFSEIAKTLYSFAKEACPEFKQTDKFLAQLKNHLEDVLAEEEISNKQEVKTSDHNQKPVLPTLGKTITTEKPKTFLNDTSITKRVGNTLGA